MSYPDSLVNIYSDLELYIPEPNLVKSVYAQRLAGDSQTAFPFWSRVWASAWELAVFLRAEPAWVKGKSVLELGAGIGLPSFVIAKQAAHIIISDHSAEAVELMKKNIALQGLSHAEAMCLDWNFFPAEIKADIVLLSDTNYASDQFGSLISLINRFLEQGSTIIIATPQRINIGPFAEALNPFIKRSDLQIHQQSGTEIRIWILSKQ